MKTINLLTAVLCITGFVIPVSAQKNLKGAKTALEVPRVSQGAIQRFVFPRETITRIQKGILSGSLDRAVAAQRAVVGENAAVSNAATLPDNNVMFNRTIIAGAPVEKEILAAMSKEAKFYAPEIEAARSILKQIFNKKIMTPEGKDQVAQTIVAHIKNPTLRGLLLAELDHFDIGSMALDLTDYFSLDKSFEQAAFDYTIRHPHRMNLNMRRLLYNPLIDEGLKNRLRFFLEASHIPQEAYGQFRIAIRAAHLQYQLRLSAAENSEIIQAQIKYLQDVTDRLSDFIVKNNRLPKWNTRSANERDLFDELDWIYTHKSLNNFEPLAKYNEALQNVVESAPSAVLPLGETIALFEQFVKTTHRYYPNSVREKLKKDDIAFEQEELLWDSLEHWRVQNEPAIRPALIKIINRYQEQQ